MNSFCRDIRIYSKSSSQNLTYVLQEDFTFSSHSAAASIVLGKKANGWDGWKDKDEKTLDEVVRQKEKEE